MKTHVLHKTTLAIVLMWALVGYAEDTVLTPRLTDLPGGQGWRGNVEAARLVDKDGAPAVALDGLSKNIVWLAGVEFGEGIISFDVKGKRFPPQESFVGVAFRVEDEKTYDAVYFRPFNFQADDSLRAAHMVQYISEPNWPWHRLRGEHPGRYEMPIEPAPNGDNWFQARVEIKSRQVSVFVDGQAEPALTVDELTDRPGGSVGLWWYGNGTIANLKVSPLSTAVTTVPESQVDLAAQVRATEADFARTMADRDADAFARYLAEDAVFFNGSDALRGKDAVSRGWSPFFEGEAAPFSWAPEVVVVLSSGTLAHSSGPVYDAEGKQVAVFNSVWRREASGDWKVVFDKGCSICE